MSKARFLKNIVAQSKEAETLQMPFARGVARATAIANRDAAEKPALKRAA